VSLEAEAEAIINFLGLKCSTSGLANALRGQFPQLLIRAEIRRRAHNANSVELALWYNSARKKAKKLTPADINRWLSPNITN
jgi:hypothetical protein